MSCQPDQARSVVRDLDPMNDLTFLRIRSKKHVPWQPWQGILYAIGVMNSCFEVPNA